MAPFRAPLPIDDVLPALAAALREHPAAVVHAPAGAGKTTRVPPAILDSHAAGEGILYVLQPRRFAARATARRMAAERGESVGQTIGFQVRFERQIGPHTRIQVMTDGVLVRKLLDDPFLEKAAAVIFDEFHERSLESDLALGMVRRLQQTVRPELKLVVMSATLAAEPIAAYLGGCPIIACAGRRFPVAIHYREPPARRSAAQLAADGVRQLLDQTEGDLLAFLPGVPEIRQTERLLEALAQSGHLAVMPLYGDLPPERQDAVLAPSERRKVVLATNVAETSVTIDGITGVVDTGTAKVLRYDPAVGLDRLELRPISRASAEQRAGRAGRTRPGVCLRMWAAARDRTRPAFEEPEIRRLDLAGAVLRLQCWDEPDVFAFPWFEPPRAETVERVLSLLRLWGATDDDGVTALGRRLARLPVSPRLGRLLVEGHRLGVAPQAALAAALLSERDPFVRTSDPAHPRSAPAAAYANLFDRVTALEEFARGDDDARGAIHPAAARTVLRTKNQLRRAIAAPHAPSSFDRDPAGSAWQNSGHDHALAAGSRLNEEAFCRAVLAAFPDRVARRREPHSPRGVMVGGRGVRLASAAEAADAELFVCVEVRDAGAEAPVRIASPVERAWLAPEFLRDETLVIFEEDQERLAARRRVLWQDLVLEESPAALACGEETAALLARHAAQRWERVFPSDDAEIGGFVERVRALGQWAPELALPPFDDAQLHRLLPALCAGRRSLAEVRRGPWWAALQTLLTWEQRQTLDREAPARLLLPSGRQAPLTYQAGKPPILAARVQELFGWEATPRIARGRIPVLLHILAPNYRVQQVTDDLASFWRNTYPQVRKDLRARYPKHAWPEDPSVSAPARGRNA